MATPLRADTAIIVKIGPFVDSGDGDAEETGLTIAQADVILTKHNGTTGAQKNESTSATHREDGMYSCPLDVTDTNTEGYLVLHVHVAGALFVRHDYVVMNANAYDAMYAVAGTDALQVDVIEQVGTTVPAPAITGVPDVNMTHHVDIAASITNSELDVNVGQIVGTAPSLTSTNIDVNVATMAAASIASGTIAAAELTNIENEILDAPLSSHIALASVGQVLNGLGARTGAVADAGPVVGDFDVDGLTEATDDHFNGMVMTFTTGPNTGTSRVITDYTGTGQNCIFAEPWVTTPGDDDEFVITNGALMGTTLAEIARLFITILNASTGQLDAGSLTAGTIDAAAIATDAIDDDAIATGAIATTAFAAGAIDAAALGADAITAAKIQDGAIDAATFAAGAINAAAIAANAIGASQLATDAIGDAQIATGAIATTAFAAGAINAAAIGADAITAAKIQDGAIDAATFAAGAIDATAIATDAIGASQLAADAIDEIRDGLLPTQNAVFNFNYEWVAASDHVTPVTSASTTSVTRSIDGGSYGSGTGTITEIGNGTYKYAASAADMNGSVINFRFVATGGTPGAPDDTKVQVITGGGV